MNGVESVVFLGLELAGSIGTSTIVHGAVAKAVPRGLNTAEKVCVGVGTGMATIAVDRVVCREVEGWYKGMKKDFKRVMRNVKKQNHKKHYNNNHR